MVVVVGTGFNLSQNSNEKSTLACRGERYQIEETQDDGVIVRASLEALPPIDLAIVDPNLDQDYVKSVLQHGEIALLELDETKKGLESVEKLWELFHKKGLRRRSIVLALGGGALQDVVAFATSTYMRGMTLINMPTTLLACCDAGFGGKTGFNRFGVKNLIGTFYPAKDFVVDTNFLSTLPREQFVSGCAEVLKHGMITSRGNLESFTEEISSLLSDSRNSQGRSFDSSDRNHGILRRLIAKNLEIKGSFVKDDPHELLGIRKALNLGHTLGHAIEIVAAKTSSPYLHGEAVALGIVGEATMAYQHGLIAATTLAEIKKVLETCELPVRLKASLPFDHIFETLCRDKKNSVKDGQLLISWTLPNDDFSFPHIDYQLSKEVIEGGFGAIAI